MHKSIKTEYLYNMETFKMYLIRYALGSSITILNLKGYSKIHQNRVLLIFMGYVTIRVSIFA